MVTYSLFLFDSGSRRIFTVKKKKSQTENHYIVQKVLCHNTCFLLIEDAGSAMRQHRVHWRGGWGISAGILVHPICEQICGYGSKGCTEWFL